MNEFDRVVQWVEPGARVLDLGCGDGALLARLRETRDVHAYGLEIDMDNIARCVSRGVNVIQADLDLGLSEFDSGSFDTVILLQTLPAVRYPARLLREMLRVGREGVVTFPNFGHWRARLQLGFAGRMPVTPAMPSQWYESENIHLFTLADFDTLCRAEGIQVVERATLNARRHEDFMSGLWPSLFSELAIYRVRRI
jgi:methionine biosynthesis protein MetW